MAGNEAVHELAGNRREALYQLKLARQLAVWLHKTITRNTNFKAGPFIPPHDPADANAKQLLLDTVAWLRTINPDAAASLKEGLVETITVIRLGLSPAL
jgi:hypothetical protein